VLGVGGSNPLTQIFFRIFHKKYIFKPYNPIFPELFLQEKERIDYLLKTALAIEHFGGTAIPDLEGFVFYFSC
jgi:GrpB-like predicted nucleotidyltransferase (UPF0157 family)